MEETNYYREMIVSNEVEKKVTNEPDNYKLEIRDDAIGKYGMTDKLNILSITEEENGPAYTVSTKSFSKKLKIFDRQTLS